MLDMHCRPSEMLEIPDAYTAFCFDEAVAHIISRLQNGEKPQVHAKVAVKNYTKPSDLYKQFE